MLSHHSTLGHAHTIPFTQTALHKAALNGHMSVIQYLVPDKADVQAQDADGWTALHNACSKVCTPSSSPWFSHSRYLQGYLDIVRWLCESAGATAPVEGKPGIDIKSKGGWTPLSTFLRHYARVIGLSGHCSERGVEGTFACRTVSSQEAEG